MIASSKTKMRMRRELLAHVTAIYMDESQRTVEETTALERTLDRFGDPRLLTRELQESLTHHEHQQFNFERLWGPRPGESTYRHAARVACWVAFPIVAMFGVIGIFDFLRGGQLGVIITGLAVVLLAYLPGIFATVLLDHFLRPQIAQGEWNALEINGN